MKKMIVSLMILFVLMVGAPTMADEPIVTGVSAGEVCQWDGILFNKEAAAELLAGKEFEKERCELLIQKEIALLEARHDLMIESLESSMIAEVSEKELIIHQYETDLEGMEALLKSSQNSSEWVWWGLGGTALGLILASTAAVVLVVMVD